MKGFIKVICADTANDILINIEDVHQITPHKHKSGIEGTKIVWRGAYKGKYPYRLCSFVANTFHEVNRKLIEGLLY